MTDEPSSTIVEPERAVLAPLDLPGEPATDRGYVTAGGTRLRARIVVTGEQETRAPTAGDVRLAASGVTLSLTIAVLDEALGVRADATGALLVMDRHEIVLSDEAMRNPAFDAAAAIEEAITTQAAAAEARLANRAAVAALLAGWGAGA